MTTVKVYSIDDANYDKYIGYMEFTLNAVGRMERLHVYQDERRVGVAYAIAYNPNTHLVKYACIKQLIDPNSPEMVGRIDEAGKVFQTSDCLGYDRQGGDLGKYVGYVDESGYIYALGSNNSTRRVGYVERADLVIRAGAALLLLL
ncbi:MAG: hypothetical protein NVSMB27_06040 [Ktedonobacteraceae bacterium]